MTDMMAAPFLTQIAVHPYIATIYYEQAKGRFRVVIQHDREEWRQKTDYVCCMHDPRFGIVASDMQMIMASVDTAGKYLDKQEKPLPPPPPEPRPRKQREPQPPQPRREQPDITLWTPIEDCEGLSMRAVNSLRNEGWTIIGQVAEYVAKGAPFGGLPGILRLPNVGKKSASEIMEVVRPLLPQLFAGDEGEKGFIDWCLANRIVLEMLRKNWHQHDVRFDPTPP